MVEAMGYDGVEYRDPTNSERRKGNSGGGSSGGSSGGTDPGGTETVSNTLYTGWLYLYRNKGGY